MLCGAPRSGVLVWFGVLTVSAGEEAGRDGRRGTGLGVCVDLGGDGDGVGGEVGSGGGGLEGREVNVAVSVDVGVGEGRGGARRDEGHGQLHVEQLQAVLLGGEAEDLVLQPLVLLLQGVQRLERIHDYKREGGREREG